MFGDDIGAEICGIGLISFDGKNNTNDIYYIKDLRHNILSVGQMYSKGNKLTFEDEICEI
jgi:hypothetical protein